MAADSPESVSRLARFSVGDWLVDPRTCRIIRGEVDRRIRPQLVDLLACLAKRPGELVLKEEILAEVWPGQFIADSGLTRCIAELRQALDDDAHQPRYIEATRKRGYRLVAPVVWQAGRETPRSWSRIGIPTARGVSPAPSISA